MVTTWSKAIRCSSSKRSSEVHVDSQPSMLSRMTGESNGERKRYQLRDRDVRIPLAGGHTLGGYVAEPLELDQAPGVLVLHEIFGLNADIRRITRRFAEHGLVALAPNLYDGPGVRSLCVLRTVLGSTTGKGAVFDHLAAAQAALEEIPRCDSERIAVAGFCLGGGFAILHALKSSNVRAVAPFYGMVPKRSAELAGICPVVGSFGERDAVFAPQGKRLGRHLRTLGIPHDVKLYPDAGHSFMSQHEPGITTSLGKHGPMKVEYHPAAAEDAWA